MGDPIASDRGADERRSRSGPPGSARGTPGAGAGPRHGRRGRPRAFRRRRVRSLSPRATLVGELAIERDGGRRLLGLQAAGGLVEVARRERSGPPRRESVRVRLDRGNAPAIRIAPRARRSYRAPPAARTRQAPRAARRHRAARASATRRSRAIALRSTSLPPVRAERRRRPLPPSARRRSACR